METFRLVDLIIHPRIAGTVGDAKPKTYERARALRKELTPAERKLWSALRGNKLNGVSFRRQHAIGNYIVDFVSIKKKLIIELDGSQHLEQSEYDEERTRYLELQGIW